MPIAMHRTPILTADDIRSDPDGRDPRARAFLNNLKQLGVFSYEDVALVPVSITSHVLIYPATLNEKPPRGWLIWQAKW